MKDKNIISINLAIAAILVCVTIMYINLLPPVKKVPLKKPLKEMPLKIDGWVGMPIYFSEREHGVLRPDDFFCATYTKGGVAANITVVYFMSQSEGQQVHSPRLCGPGQGWTFDAATEETLYLDGRRIDMNKMLFSKKGERQVYLYWFHHNKRMIRSEYAVKFYRLFDTIIKRRSDGAFVRVIIPYRGENSQRYVDETKDFLKEFIPILLKEFLPD